MIGNKIRTKEFGWDSLRRANLSIDVKSLTAFDLFSKVILKLVKMLIEKQYFDSKNGLIIIKDEGEERREHKYALR